MGKISQTIFVDWQVAMSISSGSRHWLPMSVSAPPVDCAILNFSQKGSGDAINPDSSRFNTTHSGRL